eukprot:356031-Chlamydomonas_euryale.AAC.16
MAFATGARRARCARAAPARQQPKRVRDNKRSARVKLTKCVHDNKQSVCRTMNKVCAQQQSARVTINNACAPGKNSQSVVETERGVTTTYKGNYTQYVAAKSEATALQWAAWEKQQKEVTKHRELIARLSGGAQSGRAAQAEKALEKLKEEGLIEKPFVPKKRSFTFPPVERMGQKVLTIRGLTHGYETRPLFRNVSLDIEKGDRVAIIGPNGAGKSTLLRLIMGTEQPNEGEVSLGEHNIAPNYFEQNQAEALDLKLTVLETLVRASPEAQLNDLKNLLGRMMFSGTGMEKKVGVLSGGEKVRGVPNQAGEGDGEPGEPGKRLCSSA